MKATQTCSVTTCDKPAESRGWCNSHYERWRLTGDVQADVPINAHIGTGRCIVDGCDKPTPTRGRVCAMHRQRKARSGSYELRGRPRQTRDYIKVARPGHPQAQMANGRGYLHRINLYDAIGPGTHPCAYCAVPVTWGVDLHVDHIDNDRDNNDPTNLAPCCAPCNARKGDR